ncbi:hypothetical protein GPS61_13955 [Acinetobacter haemolyticus]|uniref:hypothetical protein n=1 Tax=Acinetobacter haemolyticus TaxID=29430 RepID=UPI0013729C2D|nr:hypothetical protein [Acinetobacter haemolyticus]NAR30845.1 hypothetical protein [Acinetobacter haemolyticus]
MRLYYLVASLLLIAGCQDASNNKPNVDSTEKAEVIQETQPVNDTDDQYSADGLTRYENEQSVEEIETPQIPEEAPVRIELKLNSAYAEYGLGKIEVQATTDQVTINQVILNRGQCSAIDNSIKMPVTLSFGRTYTGYINNCALDKIIEVQINTNLGNWKFDI